MSKPLYSLDAIEFVHKHNGIVVLAHPWCYKQPLEIIKTLVEYFLFYWFFIYIYRHSLDGIECYGKSSEYMPQAQKYNLLKFVGSDYHGIKDEEVLPGGNFIVSSDAEELFKVIRTRLYLD